MAEWYFGENGQQIGPLDEAAVRQAIQQGRVTRQTLVWREGMEHWTPFAAVPELSTMPELSAGMVSPYAPPVAAAGPYIPGMMAPRSSGLATASMICGIVSLVFCQGVGAIPAIICGHMALSQINQSPLPMSGKGMAIAGLVMGYLQFVAIAVVLVVILVAAASSR